MGSRNRELPFSIFGRKARPFALAVSIATFALFVGNIITRDGIVQNSVAQLLIGWTALVITFMFWWAWWRRSNRFMAWAFFTAACVWFGRTIFITIESGPLMFGFFASIAWTVGAGGSYLLEKFDKYQ